MTHLNTSLTNICRKPALAGVVGIGFFVYADLTLERCGATSWGSWGLGGVLLAALFAIWRRLDFDAWLGGILSLAIAMCLTYATYTCLNERNYDGPDHFWYANFIAEHASIPSPNACNVCWHPPLYYLLGALVIRVVRVSHAATPECALQYLSLLLFLLFLTFGALTIREVTRSPAAQRAGIALLAFWPTSIINSIRVHDDALLSAMAVGVLYFTLRWQWKRRAIDMVMAVGFAAAAVLTKASAYAWAALPLTMLAWQCVSKRFRWPQVKAFVLALAGVALSVFAAVGWRTVGNGSACHRSIGVICDYTSEHLVGNRLINYVKFDIRFFLSEPFLINDPYDKAKDYVINNLLKTSLINAMPLGPKFEDRLSAALSTALSFLLLALGLFLATGLLRVKAAHWCRYATLILASGLALAQLLVLRMLTPLAMHADFRYVFALLIPVAAFYAKLLETDRAHWRPVSAVGLAIVTALVLASVAFFRPSSQRTHQRHAPPSLAVQASLTDTSSIRQSGSSISDKPTIRFGAHQFLEFRLPQPRDISQVDVSLDADDQYEIVVASPTFSRALWFGPTLSVGGLMRYVKPLPFPIRNATTILVRPHQSDGDYALGHLNVD